MWRFATLGPELKLHEATEEEDWQCHTGMSDGSSRLPSMKIERVSPPLPPVLCGTCCAANPGWQLSWQAPQDPPGNHLLSAPAPCNSKFGLLLGTEASALMLDVLLGVRVTQDGTICRMQHASAW